MNGVLDFRVHCQLRIFRHGGLGWVDKGNWRKMGEPSNPHFTLPSPILPSICVPILLNLREWNLLSNHFGPCSLRADFS